VKLWENRVRLSEAHATPFWEEFKRNEEFYVGQQLGSPGIPENLRLEELEAFMREGKVLIVNRVLAALAATNANIMWKIPHFYLRARRPLGPAGETARMAAESVLNYVMMNPKNDFLRQARLCLLASELAYGVMEVTYTPDEGLDPERNKDEEIGELIIQHTPEGIFMDFVGGTPKLDERGRPIRRGGNKFVVDTRNPADYFRSQFVHYTDMRQDPEGGNNPYDHSWVAKRMSWTYNEFMDSELFEHKREISDAAKFIDQEGLSRKARSRLKASQKSALTDAPTEAQGFDPTMNDRDLMRIWGYKCFDPIKREISYIVDGFTKPAAIVKYPKYIDHSSFSYMKFHEVIGEFYPIPDVTSARPLAQAYNEGQSMLLTHMGRYGRKYLGRKGVLSAREREKLKDNTDGIFIELERGDPSQVAPLKDAPLDPAIYANLASYISDFSEIMGSAPEARNIAGSGTATQAAIVESRGTARDNDKRAQVSAGLKHHADMMLACLQENLDIPMAVQVEGPDGKVFSSVQLSSVQIQGHFETYIELGELEPHDDRTERQDLTTLLQVLGPQFAFSSPSFVKMFFTAWRRHDPQMAQEFTQIAQMMMQQGQEQESAVQSQADAKAQAAPDRGGGPKATGQGPEQGRTTEGRAIGRSLRDRAVERVPSNNGGK